MSNNNSEFAGSHAIAAAAAEVSLRMKPQHQSSTTMIGTGSSNVSTRLRSGNKSGLNHHLSKLSSQKSLGSLKTGGVNGLRINSSKQETSVSTSQNKNYTTTNVDYKTRLQSKYCINAQNKMIATGALNSNKTSWKRSVSNGHLERKSFQNPYVYSRNTVQAKTRDSSEPTALHQRDFRLKEENPVGRISSHDRLIVGYRHQGASPLDKLR